MTIYPQLVKKQNISVKVSHFPHFKSDKDQLYIDKEDFQNTRKMWNPTIKIINVVLWRGER